MLRGRQPATREPILYGFSGERETEEKGRRKEDKAAVKQEQDEIAIRGIISQCPWLKGGRRTRRLACERVISRGRYTRWKCTNECDVRDDTHVTKYYWWIRCKNHALLVLFRVD